MHNIIIKIIFYFEKWSEAFLLISEELQLVSYCEVVEGGLSGIGLEVITLNVDRCGL